MVEDNTGCISLGRALTRILVGSIEMSLYVAIKLGMAWAHSIL